jgi:hypothetical protein
MRTPALSPILGATALLSAAVLAQEPWIDAGQQHMLQHQGALLEQQTTSGNESTCWANKDKERLRPEYEQRVRSEGRRAADAWLQREAAELGRQAGERARAGESC